MAKSVEKQDMAGKEYWDKLWDGFHIPGIIDPKDMRPGNVIARAQDQIYKKYMNAYSEHRKILCVGGGIEFLEIGCGNSSFLSYVEREYGFHVSGLDYSEIGCKGCERVLEYYGTRGRVYHADMFQPPMELKEKFDIVVSLGVIEHFKDTQKPCEAIFEFVKPKGMVITVIPNFSKGSIPGWVQKHFNPAVYDKHVRITREMMRCAHEAAGFKTVYCDYTLRMNFGVVHFKESQKKIQKALAKISNLVMLLSKQNIRGSRLMAPYIYYVGIR